MQAVQQDIFALIEAPPPGGLPTGGPSATGFDFSAIFRSLAATLEIGLEDRTTECAVCVPLLPAFAGVPLPGEPTGSGASPSRGEDAASTVPGEPGIADAALSSEFPGGLEPNFPAAVVRMADLAGIAGGTVLEYGDETGPAGAPETNADVPPPFPSRQAGTDGKAPSGENVFPLSSGLARLAAGSSTTDRETTAPVSRTAVPEASPVRVTPPAELLEHRTESRPEQASVLRFAPGGSNPAAVPGIPQNDGQSGATDRGLPFRQGELTLQTGAPEGALNPAALVRQTAETAGETPAVRHTGAAAPEIEQGVVDQTVRTARFLFSRDGGTVRLVLDPPELGVIRVHLEVSGNRARTWIETESATTRDLMLDTVPRLRRSLEHQSIHLESVSVRGDAWRAAGGFSHPGSSSPQGGGQQGSAPPAPFGNPGDTSPAEGTEEPEATTGGISRRTPGPNGWDLLA